jgi:hypothetical protein
MNDQQRAGRIALEEARDRSTRIRVGLTGLVGILLIVGLAGAMKSVFTPTADQVAPRTAAAQAKIDAAQVEPLAELGVAPAPQATVAPAPTGPAITAPAPNAPAPAAPTQ